MYELECPRRTVNDPTSAAAMASIVEAYGGGVSLEDVRNAFRSYDHSLYVVEGAISQAFFRFFSC